MQVTDTDRLKFPCLVPFLLAHAAQPRRMSSSPQPEQPAKPLETAGSHLQETTMTISQRLMLLVGAAIASLLALTGINYQQMNRVFDAANYANVNVVPVNS